MANFMNAFSEYEKAEFKGKEDDGMSKVRLSLCEKPDDNRMQTTCSISPALTSYLTTRVPSTYSIEQRVNHPLVI